MLVRKSSLGDVRMDIKKVGQKYVRMQTFVRKSSPAKVRRVKYSRTIEMLFCGGSLTFALDLGGVQLPLQVPQWS